jgi:hypothetical protein
MAKRKHGTAVPQLSDSANDQVRIEPGQSVELILTITEYKHLREDLSYLDPELDAVLRTATPGQPIRMTLDDLDQLSGCVAAEANHTKDKKLAKNLDRIIGKITDLLDRYTDDEPLGTLSIEDAQKAKVISDQAVFIAEWAAKALAAAEQLRIKSKVVDTFVAARLERVVLSSLSTLPKRLQRKLEQAEVMFTVEEVACMTMAVAEALPEAKSQQQIGLLLVAKTLMDSLQRWIAQIANPKKPKSKARTNNLYQFKITLLDTKPPIWRRIQVEDCTLGELHEHIQSAMGWTNSHLHQFEIEGERYGDPELLNDGMDDLEFKDSTTTRVSAILPANSKRFRFTYEYDFGDGWEHEILFEGSPAPEPGKKYPICLEGGRACPPEDIGGV